MAQGHIVYSTIPALEKRTEAFFVAKYTNFVNVPWKFMKNTLHFIINIDAYNKYAFYIIVSFLSSVGMFLYFLGSTRSH